MKKRRHYQQAWERAHGRKQIEESWSSGPALLWTKPGLPEVWYFPRRPVPTRRGGVQTVDVLVQARKGDRFLWLALEIDELPEPTRESLYRESVLDMPVVRVRAERLVQRDFFVWLGTMLDDMVDRLGTEAPAAA